MESKTITKKPRTTSQPRIQSTGAVLRQAPLILQLMQAKISQAVVVQYFEAISQTPHKELYEKKSTLKSKPKGPIHFFSSQTPTKWWIPKFPN